MLTKDYLAPQSVPLLGRFIVCPPFVPTTAAVPNKTTPCVYGFACTLQVSKTKVLEWLKNGDMGGLMTRRRWYISYTTASQLIPSTSTTCTALKKSWSRYPKLGLHPHACLAYDSGQDPALDLGSV